jgi:hypothetical protein
VTERWYPLLLDEGRLLLTKRGRFEPAGLVVARYDVTLPWDEVRRPMRTRGWWLFANSPNAYGPSVGIGRDGQRDIALARWGVVGHRARVDVANELAAYLRDTPDARPGLADPVRVTALFDALRAGRWTFLHTPHEPLLERAYDLHWAVERAYDVLWPRRYSGRPVAGEPLPDVADVVRHVRAEQHDRYTDEEIVERARRYYAVRPWPFGILRNDG